MSFADTYFLENERFKPKKAFALYNIFTFMLFLTHVLNYKYAFISRGGDIAFYLLKIVY